MRARRWISINTGCCIFIHYISLKRYFIFLPIRHSSRFISFCFLQVANNSICIFLCQLTCLILSLASHLMLIFEAPTWNYRPVGASKTRKFTTPCVVNKKIVIHLLQMMIKSKQPFEISALYESIYIYIYISVAVTSLRWRLLLYAHVSEPTPMLYRLWTIAEYIFSCFLLHIQS